MNGRRLLIALSFLVVVASQAMAGDWFFADRKDPITDVAQTGLLRESDEGGATMLVGCSGGTAQLEIVFKRFVSIESTVQTQQRFGSLPAADSVWRVSSDHDTLSFSGSASDAVRFAREMAAHDKFLIRASGQTATFTIGDLAQDLPKLSGCF